MSMTIISPGMLTTVQDEGRSGYAHIGLSSGGAMDKTSLQIANHLAGNLSNEAALEMTLIGATIRFNRDTLIALAGAQANAVLNDNDVALYQSIAVKKNDILKLGRITNGARLYLAVAAGLDVAPQLNSCSTHLLAHFGGYKGRALQKDDQIQLKPETHRSKIKQVPAIRYSQHLQLRIVPGVEADRLGTTVFEQFLNTVYTVSADSNRMGLRLEGTGIDLSVEDSMVSSGLCHGSVQLPPNGLPIIAAVESQTIGGYPRVAHIIDCDLDLLGQLAPGSKLSFVQVSFAQAKQLKAGKQMELKRYLSQAI